MTYPSPLWKNVKQVIAQKLLGVNPKIIEMQDALIQELQLYQAELSTQNEELRESQHSLECSKHRYSELYDNAPSGYLSLDKASLICEINQTLATMLGYEKSELLMKPLSNFIIKEDQDILYHHLKHLREGLTHSCELQILTKDKSTIPVNLISKSSLDGNFGKNTLQISVIDISYRYAAELLNTRLASIVENTHDAIISISSTGIIITWNKGAALTFGYDEREIMGLSLSTLFSSTMNETSTDFIRRTLSGDYSERNETIFQRKDGMPLPISFSVSPVTNSSGRGIGASIIASDITDRRKWEESILCLNQQLQKSNMELESLGKVLSHDLRAPIRAIASSVKVLADDYCADICDDGKDCLRFVIDRAMRMDSIIDSLLNIATISHKHSNQSPINLSQLFWSIASEYKQSDPVRTVEFIVKDAVLVHGNECLLRIALDNMIRNAWMYTSKIHSAIIEFGIANSRGKEAFYIRDNGEGFDMNYAERLFLPFERMTLESNFTGTGIGLDTAKRIFAHHHGEIWGESQPGKGATFFFTLPARELIES